MNISVFGRKHDVLVGCLVFSQLVFSRCLVPEKAGFI